MKEYFSHDYNARSDKKMVVVFMRHGLAGIGAYWCIIEMLYEEGGYLLLNEYERISFELRIDENVIRDIIERTELFKNDGEKFWSESCLTRLQERANKSETARRSIEKRWEKIKIQKDNTNVLQTNNDSNTIKVKESKVKESKVKEIKDINKDCFVADKSAIKTKDLEFRKNEFKNNLEPFLEIYGKVLLNDFFRYWTETNQGGKKMRFEMERVFEISKRLKTWSNNENKFKKAGGISEREKRLEGVAQLKADAAAILNHLNVKLS